jgi:bifunctional non-homologous end joining protein LigD
VVSTFARAVAEHLAWQHPDRFVSTADKSRRKGLIFVDWLRNTRGATAVASWSPRARASAGVAVPVSWTALGRVRSGDHYSIGKLPAGTTDPWRGFAASARGIGPGVIDRLAALQ